ncbi:MAG: MmcQ/YjbR family DNA-binding protein [bacterium]|nr:MmcQ/YjbR family DNA-binding protein [bacterium]
MEVLVFKVGPKMFATLYVRDGDLSMNLKCLPELAEELRAKHPAIIPGYHMNKKHWNTVIIDGSIADDFLKSLIDDSYELVFKGLKKSEREEILNS